MFPDLQIHSVPKEKLFVFNNLWSYDSQLQQFDSTSPENKTLIAWKQHCLTEHPKMAEMLLNHAFNTVVSGHNTWNKASLAEKLDFKFYLIFIK